MPFYPHGSVRLLRLRHLLASIRDVVAAGGIARAIVSFREHARCGCRAFDLVVQFFSATEYRGEYLPLTFFDLYGAPFVVTTCFAHTTAPPAAAAPRPTPTQPQDNIYPKGPSVQFYKMFLDETVRPHFSEYAALSIIEWDVMVAHDSSFEQLYHAAFPGAEPFWVKGSVLAGNNFHQTAEMSDMWHVLGHINGNAIYNNDDPAWFEFVEYARTRWEYTYPYDVALWATIADFPYSWPLWQRYSSKFVTTNLVSPLFLCVTFFLFFFIHW